MQCESARCFEEFLIVPYIPRLKVEHVQLSDMGYQRFRAHRRPGSCLPGITGRMSYNRV